jgi:hypothetical protein
MPRVMRVLFRIDYQVNYKIMDHLGEILGTIQGAAPKYWQAVGESRGNRSAIVRHTDNSTSATANLTVEISNISGSLELPEGVDWDSRPIAVYVKNCSIAAANIMLAYQISTVARIGLRVIVFDHDDIIRNNRRTSFETLASKNFLKDFEKSFGSVSDLAVTFEGTTSSNVSYRISTGPGSPSDILKQQVIPLEHYETPNAENQHQLTADIDLFEKDIDFTGNTLETWSRTKWPIAKAMLALTKRKIVEASHVN